MHAAFAISPDDEVLSLNCAAGELHVARQTLHTAILHGHLRARLLAGRFVVRREDLEAYREARAARIPTSFSSI